MLYIFSRINISILFECVLVLSHSLHANEKYPTIFVGRQIEHKTYQVPTYENKQILNNASPSLQAKQDSVKSQIKEENKGTKHLLIGCLL